MNFTLRSSLTALLLFCAVAFSFSQTKHVPTALKPINYNENVAESLTPVELSFIQEVYAEHTEKDILEKPQRLIDIKNILRNRVQIIHAPGKDLTSFVKLSQVPLFKTYNPSLIRDVSYNENSFNPLKYQFNFDSAQGSKTYWLDNSDYLIVIKSQNPQ